MRFPSSLYMHTYTRVHLYTRTGVRGYVIDLTPKRKEHGRAKTHEKQRGPLKSVVTALVYDH